MLLEQCETKPVLQELVPDWYRITMAKNISEELFETYMKGAKIPFKYEPFSGRTNPDYYADFVSGPAIIEVESLPDEERIMAEHKFSRKIKVSLEKLRLPFSISCYCTEKFDETHLRNLTKLVSRFFPKLCQMSVGDVFFISLDYKPYAKEIVKLKRFSQNGRPEKTFFTCETMSGKHEALYGFACFSICRGVCAWFHLWFSSRRLALRNC